MSSFATEGFCSQEIRKNIRPIKNQSREWFDFCGSLNIALQQIVYRVGGVKDILFSKKIIASAIFLRSVSAFQGCLILSERGMHMSAYALVRAMLEDSLCMSAIYQDWNTFSEMFREDSQASRKRQMAFILKTQNIDPAMVAEINNQIKKIGKVKSLDMKAVSELGPLEKQYLFYQLVSSNASHCSADSLRSQVIVAEDKGGWCGFRHGPSNKEAVDAVLWNACSAVIPVALAFGEIVEDTESHALVSEYALRFGTMPSQELQMIKSFRENV